MPSRVLKSTPRRTVVLDAGPPARVVKRFHAPSDGLVSEVWNGLRDRLRAAREKRRLAGALRRGLRVPRAGSIRRTEDAVELVLEAIPGAESLDVWSSQRRSQAELARVGRKLGQLLRLAQATGVRHGDPHVGNVVVDATGEPWIVDGAELELRRGQRDARESFADLVEWAAALRDSVPPRLRAHALRRVRHDWTPETEAQLAEGHADGFEGRIEARAREMRRKLVARRPEVWRRDSSNTRVEDGLVRRVGAEDQDDDVTVEGPAADDGWDAAVRLTLHGVPTVEPVCLAPGRWARFGRCTTFELGPDASVSWRRGALVGALADRGLGAPLDELRQALEVGNDRCFGPLRHLDPLGSSEAPVFLRRAASLADDAEAFRAGCRAAWRGTAAERARL